jgi:uncharacterized protein
MTVSHPLITNRQARRIFMARQGLLSSPHKPQSKDDLQALIHQLGFVQMDSIRTVERAHHMILFARNQNYKMEHLRQLHEEDRSLFEHWTHDAALIPTDFYPHWRRRFALAEQRLQERWRLTGAKNRLGEERTMAFKDAVVQVQRHVTDNGGTLARDLKEMDSGYTSKKGGWWNWHPAKEAMEFLWRTGGLSICHRDGFQKVYDLSERVIPAAARKRPEQSHEAFVDWACGTALDRLGFATAGELAAYWGSIKAVEAKSWCTDNLGTNLAEVAVESADGSPPRTAFARPSLMDDIDDLGLPADRIRVLSPFDSLIRDRKRLMRLFNFDYRIEIFVAEAKRKYGYYVFPLLEGDKLIGRIDMKAQRDDNALHVKALWLEPGIKFNTGRKKKLDAELKRHANFIGVGEVTWEPDCLKS